MISRSLKLCIPVSFIISLLLLFDMHTQPHMLYNPAGSSFFISLLTSLFYSHFQNATKQSTTNQQTHTNSQILQRPCMRTLFKKKLAAGFNVHPREKQDILCMRCMKLFGLRLTCRVSKSTPCFWRKGKPKPQDQVSVWYYELPTYLSCSCTYTIKNNERTSRIAYTYLPPLNPI